MTELDPGLQLNASTVVALTSNGARLSLRGLKVPYERRRKCLSSVDSCRGDVAIRPNALRAMDLQFDVTVYDRATKLLR